jgi:predicted Rossmann fold nucleotide-binding protein DprA/Smf involved in DNA uptake
VIQNTEQILAAAKDLASAADAYKEAEARLASLLPSRHLAIVGGKEKKQRKQRAEKNEPRQKPGPKPKKVSEEKTAISAEGEVTVPVTRRTAGEAEDLLLDALKGKQRTWTELVEATKLPRSTAYQALCRLRDAGQVLCDGRLWGLT